MGDGWTIVTKDHSLSAQWEHTVLVTHRLRGADAVRRQPAAAASWPPPQPPPGMRPANHQAARRLSEPMADPAGPALRDGYRAQKARCCRPGRPAARPRGVRKGCCSSWRDWPTTPCCAAVGHAGFPPGFWWPWAALAAASCFPTPTWTCWCCCPMAPPDADPALKAASNRFIGSCWDSGLEIGSSVRTWPTAWPRPPKTSRCRPRCWRAAW
jgi:hypothetical protein